MIGIKMVGGNKIITDFLGTDPKHVRNHGVHSQIANGKGILKPVLLARSMADHSRAVAGKFSQHTERFGRDKTASDQAHTENFGNPFGVFLVILIPFYCPNPFGVRNGDVDVPQVNWKQAPSIYRYFPYKHPCNGSPPTTVSMPESGC